ncbi:2,3-diaminopropionate biosynthesis protein SbnA [Sphingobacterium sp. DN00404]|uniref:N-(2-amino-2-carboxyethyl)-L-glutamate synthase n=1 Tax=Sphingobacterium micropteri TaxID=2763501 RepID=A0ABR7YRA1_9SPHI|nr:2,3-diaminopropionate biosynthesis protein SbnA [Sphingobacterium micropteri]MBD1433726.1 2,3-diaminopropionate biosynthesis protein SbnA [Sphingobacterium micropteri]
MRLLNKENIMATLERGVGNTPLLKLESLSATLDIQIYAKMEMGNPSGSVKDRSATNILIEAIRKGEINAETTIVESSSGNMGIALARLCKLLRLDSYIVVDPYINHHTKKLLRSYGANLVEVNEKDENQGYLRNRLKKVQELLETVPNSYWTNQYGNPNVRMAHENIFRELLVQLGTAPDYMLVATSTCGTIRGIGDAIAKTESQTRLIAVDAEGSILFENNPKPRHIPGMGASHPSSFLQKHQIDHYTLISDHQAIQGCHLIREHEGMLIGGSSGALVAALHKLKDRIPANATVALLFPDSGERYLDTIYDDMWVHKTFEKVIA